MAIEYTKDVILALLYAPDESGEAAPITGRTRLQKVLFLLGKEHGMDREVHNYYSFEPYKYGPFDKHVYEDLEFLTNVGLIEDRGGTEASIPEITEAQEAYEDAVMDGDADDAQAQYLEPTYALTEKGRVFVQQNIWNSLPERVRKIFSQVKQEYGGVALSALLRYVYRTYPEYATESELAWLKE